uniref:Centrosomin N-terminal motif 1 domain-containing protein n=1 Tax=Poecilia reticulata TaxID=8081 RepID=A0A3P9MX02_POERE
MSPIKALTMKDYENQITALKKENFNLKLRIYFMEERMQQKCDDSTEDIFKTNIELKVELESMKRELAEKQELLVSASKALESLAGRESGEPQRVREQAQREMGALRDVFNKRITELEQQLKITVKNQEALIQQQNSGDSQTEPQSTKQFSELIVEKDQELKTLSVTLEEKETELDTEKKNTLKRDKTIQGLTQVLREKEKEIEELCQEIEDRDDALAKAREAAHKAQLQKYQGVEEHQSLLMEKQTELAQLQGEHHTKVLEAQKLQRALDRKEQELADMQQSKDQLEMELEDMQQQKKKGDKALNVK